jgi:hypothetical protein
MDRIEGRPAQPRAEGSADTALRWRGFAARALGLARAFITLDDHPTASAGASRPLERVETPAHPHRQPLRTVPRARRPGAAAPRHQHCLTPIRLARPRRVPGWQLR